MELDVFELIRRFLMHVLPQGFMEIRHYGFLSSRGKQVKLPICKSMTGILSLSNKKLSTEEILTKILGRKPSVCRKCGFDGLVRTGLAPPIT